MIIQKTVETVETFKIDWETLATAVEKLVMAKLKEDLEGWARPEDRNMRAMFLNDASDGLEVCELIEDGNWSSVKKKLRDMDTAARDCVYDIIGKVAGAEFFDIVSN
jgi:hypothetical protein